MSNYQPRAVVNTITGETTYVPLTPDEIAQRDAERSAAAIIVPKPFFDYSQVYLANIGIWVRMWKALDDARAPFLLTPTPTAVTILANLRSQVSGAVAVIAAAPQGVIDALTQERILEGSTTPDPLNALAISTMTAAECRIVIDVCQKAATKGIALAAAARIATLD
jgi:hypothetical protein